MKYVKYTLVGILSILFIAWGIHQLRNSFSSLESSQTSSSTLSESSEQEQVTSTTSSPTQTLELLRQDDSYQVYHLPITEDGKTLEGQLYLPTNTDTYPLVIIGHGFGNTSQDTAVFAEQFAQNGIAAYVFDFAGGSTASQSTGSMTTMSVMTEVEDYHLVFSQLKNQANLSVSDYFFMGESQGGLVASISAKEHEDEIAGQILFYPALVIPDNARDQFDSLADIPQTSSIFGMTVGYNYYADILDLDAFDGMTEFDKPVLLVHGSSDYIVPISYSERAAQQYPDAQLVTLDGVGHGFYNGDSLSTSMTQAIAFVQGNS